MYHAVLGLPVHEERCTGGAEQLLVTIHGHTRTARETLHTPNGRPSLASTSARFIATWPNLHPQHEPSQIQRDRALVRNPVRAVKILVFLLSEGGC